MAATPYFESLYPLPTLVRRNFEPADLVDALKVNSGQRSFVDNVMILNGITVREGQWVAFNGGGKIALATSTSKPAWPVWQDPGAGRTDVKQGGITVLQGFWTVKTNVIELTALAPGNELAVGTLSGGHPVLPSQVGLVKLTSLSTGVQHTVVACVEQVGADYAIISNQAAGYKAAGST
jgi:hypothetical protein